MKAADVRRSARRVEIARVVLLLAFGGLSLRAAQLAVFEQRGFNRGQAQTLRTLTLPPSRGQVLDRSGAALALSIDAPSAYVAPSLIVDPADAARRIAPIFRMNAAELEERISAGKGFQFLALSSDAGFMAKAAREEFTAIDFAGGPGKDAKKGQGSIYK